MCTHNGKRDLLRRVICTDVYDECGPYRGIVSAIPMTIYTTLHAERLMPRCIAIHRAAVIMVIKNILLIIAHV